MARLISEINPKINLKDLVGLILVMMRTAYETIRGTRNQEPQMESLKSKIRVTVPITKCLKTHVASPAELLLLCSNAH